MNRTAASTVLLSLVGILTAACSAAPGEDPESTGSAAQADSSFCEPMELATTKIGEVCTQTDPEDGTRKRVCHAAPVTVCTNEMAAPVASAGGYPAGAPQSCAGATEVDPYPGLEGCTEGYQFTSPDGIKVAAFLCPTSIVNEAAAGTLTVELGCAYTFASALTPDNGCLGAPLDPTKWGYVQVVDIPAPMVGNRCQIVNNCGSPCMEVFGSLGSNTPVPSVTGP